MAWTVVIRKEYSVCGETSWEVNRVTEWNLDRFFSESKFSPVSIILLLLHIHSYIIWGMDNVPVSSRVPQRYSLTPSEQ
jgi:hypothetical protein